MRAVTERRELCRRLGDLAAHNGGRAADAQHERGGEVGLYVPRNFDRSFAESTCGASQVVKQQSVELAGC
jgi:hypothetical protein